MVPSKTAKNALGGGGAEPCLENGNELSPNYWEEIVSIMQKFLLEVLKEPLPVG